MYKGIWKHKNIQGLCYLDFPREMPEQGKYKIRVKFQGQRAWWDERQIPIDTGTRWMNGYFEKQDGICIKLEHKNITIWIKERDGWKGWWETLEDGGEFEMLMPKINTIDELVADIDISTVKMIDEYDLSVEMTKWINELENLDCMAVGQGGSSVFSQFFVHNNICYNLHYQVMGEQLGDSNFSPDTIYLHQLSDIPVSSNGVIRNKEELMAALHLYYDHIEYPRHYFAIDLIREIEQLEEKKSIGGEMFRYLNLPTSICDHVCRGGQVYGKNRTILLGIKMIANTINIQKLNVY